MSENHQQIEPDDLIVTTARMLVVVYLSVGVLERVGGITPDSYLNIRLFFVVTFVVGLAGVLVRYHSSLRILQEEGTSFVREASMTADTAVLTSVTIYLTIAVVGLYALSTQYPVWIHINMDLLYWLTVLSITVTLILRRDRTAKRVTKSGGFLLSSLLLLDPFFDRLDLTSQPELAVLAAVFIGLTIWSGRERSARPSLTEHRNPRPWHLLGLGIVIILAVAVFFHRLGKVQFFGDEFQTVSAAAGYYHTGQFYLWDWIASDPTTVVYDRAWPHSVFIAGSYVVFGISEWAARVPSAVAGVLSIPLAYYVVAYFTERQWVALGTSATFVLYPSLVFYFRWARMYALVIPLSLLLFYLSYRILDGESTIDFHNEAINEFVRKWLNFDLKLSFLTLAVLYIGYSVHINTLFVLPAAYLFIVYKAVTTKQRKYLLAASVGVLGICVVYLLVAFTNRLSFLSYYLSNFGRENTVYLEYLLRYPFGLSLGLVFVLAGFFSIHVTRDEPVRSKLMYLYITCSFSLVFLVYIADRYASFAYIVHLVPLALLLLIFGFHEFATAFRSPHIRYILAGLLVLNLALPLAPGTESDRLWNLYTDDDQDFSTAYETIETNYDASEEAIFGQYMRGYYLQDLNDSATVVDMKNNRRYSPEQFYRDLQRYGSGWITWETRKSYHIDPEVQEYIASNFEKHHGEGVDETGVEVYYFNQSMINETEFSTTVSPNNTTATHGSLNGGAE